jgi:hypothetical protein
MQQEDTLSLAMSKITNMKKLKFLKSDKKFQFAGNNTIPQSPPNETSLSIIPYHINVQVFKTI